MIAIGGAALSPPECCRTFLDIPIYAVTTAYYLNETDSQNHRCGAENSMA